VCVYTHHGPWMVLLYCSGSGVVHMYVLYVVCMYSTIVHVLKYILIYFSRVLCVPGIYNIFHCLLKHSLVTWYIGN